jgi:hypothetical protein
MMGSLFKWIFGKEDPNYTLPERSLNDLKSITNILFIDDDPDFKVVDILKSSGWMNTNLITDVESLDSTDIRESHIIFVDIQGVGKELKFEDEGLGLVSALREKYPTKKLVVYSAEPTGNRFHDGLSRADETLRKNADPYQFQAIVEDFSQEAFSLRECVRRLKTKLQNEFNVYKSEEEIVTALKKLGEKGKYTEKSVSEVLNIQNAGSVASIISVFMSGGTTG